MDYFVGYVKPCIKPNMASRTITNMDLSTVAGLLNARLDELGRGLAWSYASILSQYKESQKLIQACGHDTTELEHAIDAAFKANLELEMARHKAVCRFKSDGICFLVDETRRRENEFSQLQ
jgi:hypothetical protein